MQESPAFQRMKAEGTHRRRRCARRSASGATPRSALIALFGLVAGQAVVWYTAQFYALFFIQNILKVDQFTANVLSPGRWSSARRLRRCFGWLSDQIGRKPIILGGCLLAALTYFPLFEQLTRTANPALYRGAERRRGCRRRRSGRLLVPVQPDRHAPSSLPPATSPSRCWPSAPCITGTRTRRPASPPIVRIGKAEPLVPTPRTLPSSSPPP